MKWLAHSVCMFTPWPLGPIGRRWRQPCNCGLLRGRGSLAHTLVLALVLGLWVSGDACGQWIDETITLQPGWNSVFLNSEPSPNTCDAVFAGVPVDAVCQWNPKQSAVEYVQSPDEVLVKSDDWLVYYSLDSPLKVLTTLHAIQGGKPYLVKLRGADSFDWTVRGRPVARPLSWLGNSFNFVGFPVAATGGPTFQALFMASTSHAGQAVYRLTGGQWVQVANPATSRPAKGEAFWVYTSGQSDFQGPLRLTLDKGRSLEYSDVLTELTIRLKNETAAVTPCIVSVQDSTTPPDPAAPALAGIVPLSYYKYDTFEWAPYVAPVTVDVAAGEEYQLRLAVRRADMTPYAPLPGETGHLYQAVVKLSYGDGSAVLVPVTARGLGEVAAAKSAGVKAVSHIRAGLWVGTAVVNKVDERIQFPSVAPTPTASEFQLRLIVHVDANGTARLLQQVIQMWRDGTYKPDPANSSVQIVDQPGAFVLLTDEALAANFSGAVLRDGVPVGRRISTAAFGFRTPITMSGGFPTPALPTPSLSCTVPLGYNDPVNPFKHLYHPDHDNLNSSYDAAHPLPAGSESYTVTRAISLAFTVDDPEGLQVAGWGDTQLGGTYSETVSGIHKDPIQVQGRFRLQRISPVAELNPSK